MCFFWQLWLLHIFVRICLYPQNILVCNKHHINMHSGMGSVCVSVMWGVVCYAFAALRAVKQGQATPGATWQCSAPHPHTTDTHTQHSRWACSQVERICVRTSWPDTYCQLKEREKNEHGKRQGKLFKWTPKTAFLFLLFFSPPPPSLFYEWGRALSRSLACSQSDTTFWKLNRVCAGDFTLL